MIKLSVLILFLATLVLFAHALPQYDTPTDTPTDTTPTDTSTDTLVDAPTDTPTDTTSTDTSTDTLVDAPTDTSTDTLVDAPTDTSTDTLADVPTDTPTATDSPASTSPTVPAASSTSKASKIGNQITLDSSTLCIYLPPSPGGDVAGHEDDAKPFCNTTSNPLSPDVETIPTGFIVTSHFASGAGFVQYTGRIDPAAYKLNPSDQGGQYDSVGAPPGAKCVGTIGGKKIVKFVNLIEPADKTFCVRCCSDSSECNTGISTFGCAKVIPGDYS